VPWHAPLQLAAAAAAMQQPLGMRNPLRALWSAYERQLSRRPVLTQMTTSAVLWGIGDLAAQRLEQYEREHYARADGRAAAAAAAPPKPKPADKKKAGGGGPAAAAAGGGEAEAAVDWRRALLTALYGATFVGPVGHFWYHGIDKACARFFAPGTPQFIALKVAVDTAVMGPFYVSTFFAFGCAFIDRSGFGEFKRKMATDFVPTLALELSVWPFVQSINFWKVPVQHQLLVVNSATIVDAAFMSWARNQDVSEAWGGDGRRGGRSWGCRRLKMVGLGSAAGGLAHNHCGRISQSTLQSGCALALWPCHKGDHDKALGSGHGGCKPQPPVWFAGPVGCLRCASQPVRPETALPPLCCPATSQDWLTSMLARMSGDKEAKEQQPAKKRG
jgi:protein Mpv17